MKTIEVYPTEKQAEQIEHIADVCNILPGELVLSTSLASLAMFDDGGIALKAILGAHSQFVRKGAHLKDDSLPFMDCYDAVTPTENHQAADRINGHRQRGAEISAKFPKRVAEIIEIAAKLEEVSVEEFVAREVAQAAGCTLENAHGISGMDQESIQKLAVEFVRTREIQHEAAR